jgi:hypothetical protein
MSLIMRKLAAATTVAAAFSLAATPAAAVELPRLAGQQAAKAGTLDAENRRHRGHRGHGDDDIDVGDILAGVLILGGIAAIAGAAGKNREEEYRDPQPVSDARYGEPMGTESRGMGAAVDRCVSTVEDHDAQVGSVDTAARTGDVWRVAGEQENGAPWACWIDDDGVLVDLEIDGYQGSDAGNPDGQWSDADYARARVAKESSGSGPDGYTTAQADLGQ